MKHVLRLCLLIPFPLIVYRRSNPTFDYRNGDWNITCSDMAKLRESHEKNKRHPCYDTNLGHKGVN